MGNKRISGNFILMNFPPLKWLKISIYFSEKKRVTGFDGPQKRNDVKKDRFFENPYAKRRPDAFSRLGVKEDEADDYPRPKVSSRVISKEQTPASRENALAMQSRNHDLARNKRMFGSLLGTLQKFRNEEDRGVQEKRAKIDMKIDQQQLLVKEQIKQEKDTLIADRKRKQLEIKCLEIKMFKMRHFKSWEAHTQSLRNFIGTKTKPQIYYRPKVMTPKSEALLKESQEEVQRLIEEKRKEVEDQIVEMETRLVNDLQALEEGTLKKSNDGESEASDNNLLSDNENNESTKETVKIEDIITNGELVHCY